jgi:ABC-2 type transport system ATP-binding protein
VSAAYLNELLERFDVSGVDLDRRLRDQSHGMKQKIGIVQALMAQPPVLILDEPTAGLDPLMAQSFLALLEVLKRRGDTTVFLSSHVLSEVESSCERIGLVRGGRMVAIETIDSLRLRAARVVTVDFSADVSSEVPALPGVKTLGRTARQWTLEVSEPLGPLLHALAGLPVHDLQVEAFRLEDYISQMYGIEVRS